VASIKKFTDLIAWQKGHALVLHVYSVTDNMPAKEQFGLQSQIRRAVVSVTSNIVEGFDRGSSKEFVQFLMMARASLAEVQNQLLIAKDLQYISKQDFEQLALNSVEIHKIINGLIKNLRTRKLTTSN
jgi:four helix bundle protein